MNELEALVALTETPLMGSIKIRLLIQQFGSALETLDADPDQVAELPGFGPKIMSNWGWWKSSTHWKTVFEAAANYGARIIPHTSAEYPKQLLNIPDYPMLLYVIGEIQPCDQHSVAVIGTRYSSVYGMEMAGRISQELAEAGITVISGLARGIDSAAHKGAIRRGRSIAVIGSGLADIYPRENISLAKALSENGALVSEFSMHTPPDRQNFPQRNRIVSGMSRAILLIEAPIKSGAMITMRKGLSHGKELFALPGRVDCDSFHGNHMLIKNGQAQLVESARDIIESFEQLPGFSSGQPRLQPERVPLEKEEKELLAQMPNEETSFDAMMHLTKHPVAKLNILLMSLILKKVVKEFPGKMYKKDMCRG